MHEPIEEDTLLEAVAALSQHDVEPSYRERIGQDCRAVLQRMRRRSAPWIAPRRVSRAPVYEAVLAAALSACYLIGVLERALILFPY